MSVQTIKYENSANIATDEQGNVLVDNAGNVIVPVPPPVVLFNAGLNNVIFDYAPVVTGSISYNGTTSGFSFNLPSENDKVYEYTPFNVKLVKHSWNSSVGVGVVLNLRTIKEQFGGEFEFSITAGGYYQNAPDAEIQQATIAGVTYYYTYEEYQGYRSAVRWGNERTDLSAINRCGGDVNFGKFTVTCSDYSFEINTDNATISGGGRVEGDFGYYYAGPCGEIWQDEEPSETYEWRAVDEWCDGMGSTYYTGCIYDSDGNKKECTNDYIFSRTWAEIEPNPGEDGYDEDLNRESVSQVSDKEYRRCAVVLDEFGTEYAYWRDESKDVNTNYTLVELNKVVNKDGKSFYVESVNGNAESQPDAVKQLGASYIWTSDHVSVSASGNPASYPYDGHIEGVNIGFRDGYAQTITSKQERQAIKDDDGNIIDTSGDYLYEEMCQGVKPCGDYGAGVTTLRWGVSPVSIRAFAVGDDDMCHNFSTDKWYTIYQYGDYDSAQQCRPVTGIFGSFIYREDYAVQVNEETWIMVFGSSDGYACGYYTYATAKTCLFWYNSAIDKSDYGKGYVWKADGNIVRAYTLSPCYDGETAMPETIYERAAGSLSYYTTPEGDAASYRLVRNNNNIYSLTPTDLASVLYRKNVPQSYENPTTTTIDEEFE